MFHIYTDGSCLGNPGPGGWSAVIIRKNKTKIISGYVKKTTNNQMELFAVIKALELFHRRGVHDDEVIVFSDSAYVVNNIKYLERWRANNFNNGELKNIKLWKALIKALDDVPASFLYVKGHNGNEYNELADKEARKQAKIAKQRLR